MSHDTIGLNCLLHRYLYLSYIIFHNSVFNVSRMESGQKYGQWWPVVSVALSIPRLLANNLFQFFGLSPSSGVVKTIEHTVSEIVSVSVLRCGGVGERDFYCLWFPRKS
jgi:hypothetical protein